MTTPQDQQPAKAVVVSAPLISEEGAAVSQPMVAIVTTLAKLRERYHQDMVTAREKVKKNFLG